MFVKNRLLRVSFFVLGFCSVALGIAGAFLPLLPTTPFLLLAAWCFVKSSPKTHKWLYEQPALGKALRDWDRNKSIARPTKVTAMTMILFSLVVVWMKTNLLWLKILVSVILLVVSAFICTRNEGKR